jgi:predicted DNA helicase
MAEERLIRINKILRELNLSLDRAVDFLKEKDIHIESSPNAKLSQEEYKILCNQFSPDKGKMMASIELSKEFNEKKITVNISKSEIQSKENNKIVKNDKKLFTPGNVVKVKISKIITPSQIITDYVGGYIGRLSLVDISWSFPQSEQLFKKYKVGDTIDAEIFYVDEKNKQIIITQKHLVKPYSQTVKWERLERGEEFDVEIVQNLNNIYIVQTKNKLFGIVRKSLVDSQNNELRLKINSKIDESNLIDFIPSYQEQFEDDDTEELVKDHLNFIEEDLQSFAKFKKTLLGQSANDKEIQIIRKGFDLDENIFSKEIDTGVTLYIQFLINSSSFETDFKQKAIPFYLNQEEYNIENEKAILDILSNQKYWIKINKRFEENRKNNKEFIELLDFSIYNEEINLYGFIEIFKDNKNVKFGITNFSIGQNLGFASKIKKDSTKNGSFLFNNKLKVLSPLTSLPFDNSQKQFLDYCLTKLECFEVVEKLKLDTGEILKQEGRTLAIIDKFLEYQISLLASDKENNVLVEKFEKINSSSGRISIKLPREIGDKFEYEEGTVLNVKLFQMEKLTKLSDGFISIQDDNYILNFYKDINTDLLQNGFYLDKRISTKQFDIQREIIKDFLEKKIKIDHIESLLVNPSKVKSPILKHVKFKNEDLHRTELEQPDNIQVRAVKKAIGNQNIFLIQGPPGTGKTTVIAEIIEQLTANDEKILVSGQNHVAVDNVLEKIAKNPNLNLLRVGNPERVDKGLLKYCYDNLVEEYQIDYKLFIKNQKKLTELLLDFVKNETDSKERLLLFNEKVNEVINDYNYLKDTFKEKHFILRDNLQNLSVKELFETIQALNQWDESFSNEYEVLLQPIIYNSVDVVFATCIGIKGDKIFKDSGFKFDTVIIDEAGKANIAETLVAIELGKKVILVGDQMQLPPYMDSSLIDKEDPKSFPNSVFGMGYTDDEIAHALKTSFFEFIIKRMENKQFPSENKEMLNFQHRMHPNIGNFVSESFYGSKVFMGSRTHLNSLELPAPFDKEIIFFDTSNSKNPFEQKEDSSIKNDTEAEFVAEYILPKLLNNNVKSDNIAIIAPYKFQVANIKEFIKKSTACQNKNIEVATLDSFQGKEYDIIIFSFTRSSDHNKVRTVEGKKKFNKVGFLDDARRLNVAFSRAKKKLILVGNENTLTDYRSHFDVIFNYTNLFRKLVQLSKNDKIGNFINIADYHSSSTSFEKIVSKYKVGDLVSSSFKSLGVNQGKTFGAFFYINGFECLLPISFISMEMRNKIILFKPDDKLDLVIHEFDKKNERITLDFPKDIKTSKELAIEKKQIIWNNIKSEIHIGKKINAKILTQVNFGFFVKLDNDYDALLHNRQIPNNIKLKVNDSVKVEIFEIDFEKKQISLKL